MLSTESQTHDSGSWIFENYWKVQFACLLFISSNQKIWDVQEGGRKRVIAEQANRSLLSHQLSQRRVFRRSRWYLDTWPFQGSWWKTQQDSPYRQRRVHLLYHRRKLTSEDFNFWTNWKLYLILLRESNSRSGFGYFSKFKWINWLQILASKEIPKA